MDLSIIILIRFMALSYNVYAMTHFRPAWSVQTGWVFEVVPANAVDGKDQIKAESVEFVYRTQVGRSQ